MTDSSINFPRENWDNKIEDFWLWGFISQLGIYSSDIASSKYFLPCNTCCYHVYKCMYFERFGLLLLLLFTLPLSLPEFL